MPSATSSALGACVAPTTARVWAIIAAGTSQLNHLNLERAIKTFSQRPHCLLVTKTRSTRKRTKYSRKLPQTLLGHAVSVRPEGGGWSARPWSEHPIGQGR